MAVKIRLARRGKKGAAVYSIVIADARAPRDGKFIEKIGTYNPNTQPSTVLLDSERALHWMMVGAQPTDTTRSLLSKEGVMLKKHLQVGVNKGAITQEQADEKFQAWKDAKNATLGNAAASVKEAKEAAAKAEQEARIAAKAEIEAAKVKAAEEAAAKAVEEAKAIEAAKAAAEEVAASAEDAEATTEGNEESTTND